MLLFTLVPFMISFISWDIQNLYIMYSEILVAFRISSLVGLFTAILFVTSKEGKESVKDLSEKWK
jgi:hypothetical protein